MTYFRCGLCHATKQCRCEIEASERRDPWVVVGTAAVDGTHAELAAAFGVVPGAVGACVHGLIEGGHVRDVRGRNLRPTEWVPLDGEVGMVLCDVVRRQSEIDAERAAIRPDVKAVAEAHGLRYVQRTCPECGPHGNARRVLLLESWVDCTTCRPTACALSSELIAEGASSDVAQNGVRAFIKALDGLPEDAFRVLPVSQDAVEAMVYFRSGRRKTFPVPAGCSAVKVNDDAETVEFVETTSTISNASSVAVQFTGVEEVMKIRKPKMERILAAVHADLRALLTAPPSAFDFSAPNVFGTWSVPPITEP